MNRLVLTAALVATAMGVAIDTATPALLPATTIPAVPSISTPAAASAAGLGGQNLLEVKKRMNPTTTTKEANPNTVCSGDTTSTEGVQALMDASRFPGYLDIWLSSYWQHETDWVDGLWGQLFPNGGQSPLTGCGTIDGQCADTKTCDQYPVAEAYWILQSVQLLQSKMNAARSTLTYRGWLDSLTIDKIGSDFSIPTPNHQWATYAALSFGIVSNVGGAVGTVAALVASMFWTVVDSWVTRTTVNTASVESTLSELAGDVGDAITQLIKDATGNGVPNNLPVGDLTTFQYATARFFSQSGILVDENKDNSTFNDAFDSFITNLEKKIVTLAMSTAYYIVLDDTDITQQSDCDTKGALWLPAGNSERCFYLTRPYRPDSCTIDDPTKCYRDAWQPTGSQFSNSFDTGIYDKLNTTYGFDINDLYTNAIDCALNGNGTADAGTYIGGVPRCFYNIWVGSGAFAPDAGSTRWQTLDGLTKITA